MRLLNQRQTNLPEKRRRGDVNRRDRAGSQRGVQIQADSAGVRIMPRARRRVGRRDRATDAVHPLGRDRRQVRKMPLLKGRRPEADG